MRMEVKIWMFSSC